MIFRQAGRRQYLVVAQSTVEDTRLSLEARGLLLYLLARPDDWTANVAHMRKVAGCGRDKLYRILKELEVAGYLRKARTRLDSGQFITHGYDIYESPMTGPQPLPENTEVVPLPENPQPLPENTEVVPLPENPQPLPENPQPLPENPQPLPEKPDTVFRTLTNTEYITKKKCRADKVSATPSQAKKPRAKRVDPATEPIPDSINPTAWAEWWQYKGGRVAPVTVTKTINLFNQLDHAGQQRMVDASIANQWKGLFPEKFANETRQQSGQVGKYAGIDSTLNNKYF